MSFGALSDIKVIDLTQMLAGPYGTMMLSDQGAEVIKIEPPSGDMVRPSGPYRADDTEKKLGGYLQSINRNKKSVMLDLKTKVGRDAFLELIKDADAVVENFRLGVMEKFDLSYETLKEVNPRLVYATLRGFGDPRTGESPYSKWPAFDVVAQAMGGIMGITGPTADQPTKIGPGVGDIIPGMFLGFGVLAAIHNARRTGQGQFVDVSMVDSILAICERMVYQNSLLNIVPGPEGNGHPFLCPFGMFPAKDGHITIATPAQPMFELLCDLLDAPHIKNDERFAAPDLRGRTNRLALIEELSKVTSQYTKAELVERLGGKIPFGPVLQMDDISTDPHFAAREMIVEVEQPGSHTGVKIAGVPIKMTETPGGIQQRAPYIGEHSEEVLRGLDLTEEQLNELLAKQPDN